MNNNRKNILGWYDKKWYIKHFGWEFMSELESKLLDKYPHRSREKAIEQFGYNKVDEIEKSFCDEQIEKEKNRLENYYGNAMHYPEKTIHILYDNDPSVDDVFIDRLIEKRKEYEIFTEQIQTDLLIYNSPLESDEKKRVDEEKRYGNYFN